jgi:molecular chaperone DnaK
MGGVMTVLIESNTTIPTKSQVFKIQWQIEPTVEIQLVVI